MRQRIGIGLSAALCVTALCYPTQAAGAVRAAMEVWAGHFVPALFPFFFAMPALGCAEAVALYERAFGRWLPRLFGCPARAAGAVAMGWMAGSPAGALALSGVSGGMTGAELTRAALLCSGLSPAFLISSVGASMLGSPADGRVLAFAQLCALATAGALLSGAWRDDGARAPSRAATDAPRACPMWGAVRSLLAVCGWMALFSVVAALLRAALPALGAAALPFLEIAGGCAGLAGLPLDGRARLTVIGFFCGLGGLSVGIQNCGQLPGLKPSRYALGKLAHGALTALYTAALSRAPWFPAARAGDEAARGVFMAGAAVFAVVAGCLCSRKKRAASTRL